MKTTTSHVRAQTAGRAGAGVPDNLRVVYTKQQIRRRVAHLAEEINEAYEGRTLHIVAVSDDCFLFMADLVRALKCPVVCHFVSALVRPARLANKPGEEFEVQEILYTPALDLAGKDVLLLRAIVYSGVTLDFLYRQILAKQPKSLRIASLVEKPEDRKVDVATDYLAFRSTATAGEFLVGYGLGREGVYRNLPCIAVFSL